MARADCSACKGRAINCDRTRPVCINCSRARRRCQWNNIPLSWPRANDRRRSIVCRTPMLSPAARNAGMAGEISDGRFIHTSQWDIEFYQNSTSHMSGGKLSFLDIPPLWNPLKLGAIDQDLFEYFCCVASGSLATFGHDATALGKTLVRIALDKTTASSSAMLQALLAFSSLHRYGLHDQALRLKIAALRRLAEASAAPDLCARDTVQHAATGMLFCSFEVHQSSCTSGQWTNYLGGVKTVITASCYQNLHQFDSDVAVLLDWVHYHDVLARFSLRHWNRQAVPLILSVQRVSFRQQFSNLPPLVLSILDLLSEICGAVSTTPIQPETSETMDNYKNFLTVLDWRIRSLPIPKGPKADDNTLDDESLIMQLYQLAMLLYLNRSSEGLVSQPSRTQQQVDKAFSIISGVKSCKQQFPILIIGCEARTDEQRAIILDIITRSEGMSSSRSFNYCKRLLEAVWAQDDLNCGNDISYCDVLGLVMNRCRNLPTFV